MERTPHSTLARGANVPAALRRSMLWFFRQLASRLSDVGLARAAGSLSFTTLLGIVPLVTVTFAAVAEFPAFQQWVQVLEAFLLRYMLPESASGIVREYVLGFALRAAQLRGLAIVLVIVTATLVFATIESEINAIFRVGRGRSYTRRIIVYAVGLTLGPVLVGASISLTSWLIARSLAAVPIRETIADTFVQSIPFALTAIAYTLLYRIVPAKDVRWLAAIAGGVPAALAFEIAKHAFAWYVRNVPTYELVYGAFAALPIFLIWLFVCWVIVLIGAGIAATLDAGRHEAPR